MDVDNSNGLLQYYVEQGFSLIPLKRGTKEAIVKWKEFQKRKPTDKELDKIKQNFKNINLAVICGKISGNHIVFDFESEELARSVFPNLDEIINMTLVVKTAKGYHIHFNIQGELPKIAHIPGKMDILSEGSVAILPPSLHPSGIIYSTANNGGAPIPAVKTITELECQAIIDRVIHATGITKESLTSKKIELKFEGMETGGRNNAAFDMARNLKYKGHDVHEALKLLEIWNTRNTPPLEEHEITSVIKSVFKDVLEKGEKKVMSTYDVWMESAVKNFKASVFRTEITTDKNGKAKTTVVFDLPAARVTLVKDLMNYYYFATFIDNEEIYFYDESTGLYVPYGEQLIQREIQNIIELAGLEEKITSNFVSESLSHIRRKTFITREEFESDKNLLCLANGVLDIRDFSFRQQSPEFKFLSKLAVSYNPNATCPKFDEFLSQIVTPEEVPLLKEIAGYCLYKDYFIQKGFMFVGSGRNGKSTFIRVIEKLVGTHNCSNISLHALEGEKFALSSLYKKYINFYADLSSDELKSTGKFKMLTGGDSISAEYKNKDSFSFRNYAKLIFSCNAVPRSEDDTEAYWRRWFIIDFSNKFEGTKDNKQLIHELTTEEELSGILNEVLIALKTILERQNFCIDEPSDKIREKYIRRSDSVKAFSMDEIEIDSDSFVIKNEVFEHYIIYCQNPKHKYTTVTETKFTQRFLGSVSGVEPFYPTVGGKQVKAWKGIKFKNRENVREDSWYSVKK